MPTEIQTDMICCLEFLTVIAGRRQKDALIAAIHDKGGRLMTVVYGKGSVQTDYLRDMFCLVPEENKVVITCLLPARLSGELLDMLVEKFRFDQPNTGIAFTVPVDKIAF